MGSLIEHIQMHFPGRLTFILMNSKRILLPWTGHSKSRHISAKLGSSPVVLKGPFAGMRYVAFSCGSRFLPKLIGAYELELHSYIYRLISLSPDLVVDVGTAEGYYAVGMARSLPNTQVIGYDTSNWARFLLRRMAIQNGVSQRVQICGFCTPEELNSRLVGATRPVVICDCEGFETELLDLSKAPELARATILVELHEWIRKDIAQLLHLRFGLTHKIIDVQPTVHSPRDWDDIGTLSKDELLYAINDDRPAGNSWSFMVPRESGPAQGR